MSESDDPYAPEVAFFFVAIGALSLCGLNNLHGRFSNVRQYISGRSWPFIKRSPECHEFYIWYFGIILTITVLMCPAGFAIWCLILFYNEYHDNKDYMPPVAITLIGVAAIAFALAILSLKWNKYKLTVPSIILFLLGGCSLVAYQICGNFQVDAARSFFGLSAVFLSCNVIVVIFIIFLNEGMNAANFFHILANKLEITQEKPMSNEDLLELYKILDKKANHDYMVTKQEIDFFFTIEEEDTALVSGGVLMSYASSSIGTRVIVTTGLYVASLLVMVGYAFVIYETVSEYDLGFITMAATVVIDSIIYLFYHIRATQSTFQLCFIAILFRVCLFAFDRDYWYYGYCVLYGLVGIIVDISLSVKYFPLKTTVDPIKRSYFTSNFRMELKDIMKTPEFILFYASLMFAVLTLVLVIFEPEGVPLPSVYSAANEFPFWNFALLAFGVVVICYLLFATTRIVLRRKQQVIDEVYVYFFKTFLDIFWIHVYLCYGVLIVAGIVGYGMTDEPMYLIMAAFLPLAVIEIIHTYVYYAANDYRMLKDIAAENQRREAMRTARKERLERKPKESNGETIEGNETEKRLLRDSDSEGSVKEEEHHKNYMGLIEALEQELPDDERIDAKDMAIKEVRAMEPLPDWRETHNVFTAFWTGKLFKNDYRVILGFLGTVLLLFLNSMTLELSKGSNDSYFGVTVGVILVDVFLTTAGCFNHIITDLPFRPMNIVLILIGVVTHIVYGFIYFVYVEDGDLDVHKNLLWLWLYVFIIPPVEILVLGFYKHYRRQKKMSQFTLTMCAGIFAIELAFAVHLWIRYTWLAGIIVLLILAILAYFGVFIYFYASNGYSMSVCLYISNITVCVVIAALIMISGWVIESIGVYAAFSITYGVVVLGGMGYFFGKVVSMCTNYETKPIFISPYIFPIYAYSDSKKSIVTKNFNVGGAYVSLLLLTIWGILTSMFLRPMHYGVSVTCLALVLFAFITFFLIVFTPVRLMEYQKWFTKATLTDAWLEAKKLYIESEKITKLEKLVTYKDLKEAYTKVQNKEDIESVRLTPFIERKVYMQTMNNADRYNLLAEIDVNRREQYFEELELMIEFQIMALLLAGNAEISYRRKTLKFADENKKALAKLGIQVEIQGVVDQKMKYLMITNQINKLLPAQKKKFEVILAKYEIEQENKRREEEEKEKREEEERMKKLERRSKPKIDHEAEKYLPIDEMTDSYEKFDKILDKFDECEENGIPYKYRDKQFPPNEKSIGPRLSERFKNWKEALPLDDDKPKMVMYDGDFDMDVKQGALGDCYFLSALGVLDEKKIKACICEEEDYFNCGAFCVSFFNDEREEEIVIIDDFFPVNSEGTDWAFVKSENGKELWPMIMEKAYAKFFGSYEAIESGKVCYALADLTGGIPEQIKLEEESKHFDEFCKKIFSYHAAKHLMGAGSNPNIAGDSKTVNGIVQGHAYSILDVAEYDGQKLIKLRNPHGSGGVEWSGSWSDESPLWTEAAKAKLGYNVLNKKDGVFWMTLRDFIFCFDNLYVCRVFGKNWKTIKLAGEWDATNTPGLPSDSNPNPKLESNPHYLISVTKPSTLFIELTQCEKINMSQGKLSIYFFIGNNKGQKINKTTKNIRLCSSYPPTNLIKITRELMLDSNYFYPIKLSLMVCTEAKGVTGSYFLNYYSTDEYSTIVNF